MPTAQINLGTATITLGASGDLSKLATKPVVMTILGDVFKGNNILETPIGSVPPFSIEPQIEFSDAGAWKAAGQSDALTLSVDAGMGGTLALIGQSTPTQVQLQVRDTGSGMPAEQLSRIFEPLYTTKPGGTGLGLYIVQEIIAAHGGQVTVESVLGQGTTFTLTLPRTGPPGAP